MQFLIEKAKKYIKMKVDRKLKPPGAQQQKTHFGGVQKRSILEASIEIEGAPSCLAGL